MKRNPSLCISKHYPCQIKKENNMWINNCLMNTKAEGKAVYYKRVSGVAKQNRLPKRKGK